MEVLHRNVALLGPQRTQEHIDPHRTYRHQKISRTPKRESVHTGLTLEREGHEGRTKPILIF